jgi:hypothetical protein
MRSNGVHLFVAVLILSQGARSESNSHKLCIEPTDCVFPFTYLGVQYTSCTEAGTFLSQPWCSADSVYKSRYYKCTCAEVLISVPSFAAELCDQVGAIGVTAYLCSTSGCSCSSVTCSNGNTFTDSIKTTGACASGNSSPKVRNPTSSLCVLRYEIKMRPDTTCPSHSLLQVTSSSTKLTSKFSLAASMLLFLVFQHIRTQ